MLAAKFFAALAIVFLICAGLAWLSPMPALDIYIHDKYVAFGPKLVLLFCAATSVNFAVLYYAAVRIFRAQWNRTISVLHICFFVCFAISFAIVFTMSARVTNGSDPAALRWLVIPFFAGILSFVIGFALFGVNLTLTVFQVVRARFAGH
jgi:hypothetical protein